MKLAEGFLKFEDYAEKIGTTVKVVNHAHTLLIQNLKFLSGGWHCNGDCDNPT